jgi:uncharacterized protein (DUF1501 family)
MKTSNPLTRRRFLGRANCAAISSIPIANTLLNLKLAGDIAAAAPGPNDYRALVCLFFSGGIDSFNLLAPRGDDEYNEYKAIRTDLALTKESLLPITPVGLSGIQLGLHPGLSSVKQRFDAGQAAFVANVGTLIEPVTRAQYDAGLGKYPLGLFSHSDQIEQWQTGVSDVRSSRGWCGRAADLVQQFNGNNNVSMNISLAGSNVWQSGNDVYEYSVSPYGAEGLAGYDPAANIEWDSRAHFTKGVNSQLALDYQHLLTKAFSQKKRSAMDAYQLFDTATKADLPETMVFPAENYIADQLRMVVKSIRGAATLGHKRQTFFINVGGWDHHDEVLNNMGEMVPRVDAAIGAFFTALDQLGVSDKVTLFSASDFGRTLTSNGEGSDHAWGGNHFVVGGAVAGNKIYGQYPELYEDNPIDLGRGRIVPTTAVDLYFAELALWLGVPKSSLNLVLPNITNFYSLSSASNPVGFLP